MNRHVASTSGLTTVSSRLCRSAIASPVVDAGPAERIGADPDPLLADDVDVDHVRQVVDVGVHEVVPLNGLQRAGQRHPLHRLTAAKNLVGALGDCVGRIGVGGTAVGRVVLEAAVIGRVVRRRHHDPVGQSIVAAAVVGEDRVADRRRRRVAVSRVNGRDDVIGGEHLDRRHPCGLRETVRISADEQRSGGAVRGAVFDDGLGDGQDVGFVECAVQRRAAVPRRSERHLLGDVLGIRLYRVVGRDQMRQIDEVFGLSRLTGSWVGHHVFDCA
jgi:hypothetical protein